MSKTTNKMTGDFAGKSKTQEYAAAILKYLKTLGQSDQEAKGQLSFSVKRKFLWLWVYDKTPDGTLYMTVCVDRKINDPRFHYIQQTSANRWNHHVVVKSASTAKSAWLHELIRAGYEFAQP